MYLLHEVVRPGEDRKHLRVHVKLPRLAAEVVAVGSIALQRDEHDRLNGRPDELLLVVEDEIARARYLLGELGDLPCIEAEMFDGELERSKSQDHIRIAHVVQLLLLLLMLRLKCLLLLLLLHGETRLAQRLHQIGLDQLVDVEEIGFVRLVDLRDQRSHIHIE